MTFSLYVTASKQEEDKCMIHLYSVKFVHTTFKSAVITVKPKHTDFDLRFHTPARSPSLQLNGLHLHNPCKYMDDG